MLTTSFLACSGAAARGPGDERPHVRRRRDPGQPADPARARGRGDRARGGRSPRAASSAGAACPTRPSCWPGSKLYCRPASAPGTGCGCWSPPAAPASRSTRCVSRQPLQRPHGLRARRRRRPPRRRRHPDRRQRRPARAGGRPPDRRRDRRRARRGRPRRVRLGSCPADGRRPRRFPGRRARPASSSARARWISAWSRPRTSSPASRPPATRTRRSSASPRNTARTGHARPRKADPQGRRPNRPQRRLRPSIGFESTENAVTLIDLPMRPRPEGIKGLDRRSILDRVEPLRAEGQSPQPADTQSGP